MRHLARQMAQQIRCMVTPHPRIALLKKMPRNAICGEIGVWKGEFSTQILKLTQPAEFHMIDPWTFQPEFPDRMYGGAVAKQQEDMDLIYKDVKERFGSRLGVKIHRETSEEALAQFRDGFFDWLYIDGNHYYEYVLKDLELAFLKVRPGGFITGDDFSWGETISWPVKMAVKDFLAQKRLLNDRLEVLGSQFIIRR